MVKATVGQRDRVTPTRTHQHLGHHDKPLPTMTASALVLNQTVASP